MREVEQMLYLQETPVILDDSKLLAKLPVHKTPYDDVIRLTVERMRGKWGGFQPASVEEPWGSASLLFRCAVEVVVEVGEAVGGDFCPFSGRHCLPNS